jgi:uncharacterized protein YjbI with pentapeptide repeats
MAIIIKDNKKLSAYGGRKLGTKMSKNIEDDIYQYISRDFNNCGEYEICQDITMPTDLRRILFYQASFSHCKWNNCDLTRASANGATFDSNDHNMSIINYASMQYCNISKDIFDNCTITGSGLSQSSFFYTLFNECSIMGSSFVNSIFHNCIIRNCKIESSNFELCRFQGVDFSNIDLSNLNFRFSFFKNIHMKNVTLPFLQMPYTFNGMQYIFETKDDIYFEAKYKKSQRISRKHYIGMVDNLINFFKEKQSYFPLANCYHVKGEFELAKAANKSGIVSCSNRNEFGLLYYYCLQACLVLKIKTEERKQLFKLISENIHPSISAIEKYQFGHYYPLIRSILFDNPYDNPVLSFTIETNITPDESEELGELINIIESVPMASNINLDGKQIVIRRNSPAIIEWLCSGNAEALLTTIESIWEAIKPLLAAGASIASIAASLQAIKAKKVNTEIQPSSIASNQSIGNVNNNFNEFRKEIEHKYRENQNLKISLTKQKPLEASTITKLMNLKEKGVSIGGGSVNLYNTDRDSKLDSLYSTYLGELYSE